MQLLLPAKYMEASICWNFREKTMQGHHHYLYARSLQRVSTPEDSEVRPIKAQQQ
jgi:hypothetical protein